MAHLSASPQPPIPVPTCSSTPQPLTRESLRQHTKAVAVSSKKHKPSRPASPQRTFLCQDQNYPRTRPKPLRLIEKAYASSSPSAHWRGDGRALFKLDPAAKYNIRDYLMEQCKAQKQTTNELTKPTGTKIVFVLQFNDEDKRQKALCVQTNATTLYGIYDFRNAQPTIKKVSLSHKMLDHSTKNRAPRRLPRSRCTASFALLMTSANGEGFPLVDHELDSDSDEEDGTEAAPSPYTTSIDAIVEGDKAEAANDGFVNVVDLRASKYCRDPESADHPECHGRYKADSYAHNVVDAELDFQERFVTMHNGRDSAAYYRNWRTLKFDHGETMVHGQSSLRNPVAGFEEEDEDGHDDVPDDSTEQLLRLIAKKYGPLTLEGQKPKTPPTQKCSEECSFKIDKYLDQDCENDTWPLDQPFDNENEKAVFETSTMFEGVVGFTDDDVSTSALTPAPVTSTSHNVPVMTEEELEKLLDTPHEDFINGYLQRYEVMRKKIAREKQARKGAIQSAVPLEPLNETPIAEVETVVEHNVTLPEFIVTAATPASSPTKEVTLLTGPATIDHGIAGENIFEAYFMISDTLPEQVVTLQSCDITAPAPAALSDEAIASRAVPVFVRHEVAPVEHLARPASAQSSCSSRDGPSLPDSVFSRQASVITKPSNESFGSDHLRVVDTLDLQVDVKPATTTVSHHERSVSMPTTTLSALNMSETSVHVSQPNHNAHAQSTCVVPSTDIRAVPSGNSFLTPIIEVPTPLSSYPKSKATMFPSTFMDDPYEGFPPTHNSQQPHTHISPQSPCLSRNHPVQPIQASVFTDDSSFTTHRQHSSRSGAIKYRAKTVVRTTKRAVRRVLRSVKKIRTIVQYFVPATFDSRNPFETVSRR